MELVEVFPSHSHPPGSILRSQLPRNSLLMHSLPVQSFPSLFNAERTSSSHYCRFCESEIVHRNMEHRVLTRRKAKEHGQEEELIPGIVNEVTLEHIISKLPWSSFQTLSLVSRAWVHSIRTRRVHYARVRSCSTETFVLVSPIRSRNITSQPRGKKWGKHMKNRKRPGHYPFDAISLFFPNDNSSCELPHLPTGIPRSCKCVSVDGKIYVLGGENLRLGRTYGGPTRKVYVLDLATGRRQWKECASMSERRVRFGCRVMHGKIYVFGGFSRSTPISGSEVYDPKTNAWSKIKPMSVLRFDHDVEVLGEELWVHGGMVAEINPSGPELIPHLLQMQVPNFAEVYNPVKDEWRVVKPFGVNCGNEVLFIARGRLHSVSPLGLCLYDVDAGENSWKRLHSVLSLFSRVVGPVDSVIAEVWYSRTWMMTVCSSIDEVKLLSIVAVHDELLAVISYFDEEDCETKFCLLQSRGFCSGKEIVWRKAQLSFSSADEYSTRLYPIQL